MAAERMPAVRGAVDPGNGSHAGSSPEGSLARFPRPAGADLVCRYCHHPIEPGQFGGYGTRVFMRRGCRHKPTPEPATTKGAPVPPAARAPLAVAGRPGTRVSGTARAGGRASGAANPPAR